MNIYYEESYQKERGKYLGIFEDKYMTGEKSREMLTEDYSIQIIMYSGEVEKSNITASKNFIYDNNNELIYTYFNLDTSCEFSAIFKHQNGKNYMVFRTDIYGYSVLDLNSKEDFHYMPKAYEENIETFIWTDVSYNDKNNILLVYGCYFACSSSLMIVDFSNPIKENRCFDIQDIISDISYEKYEDIRSYSFNGRDIIIDIYNCRTEKREEKRIAESEYLKLYRQHIFI